MTNREKTLYSRIQFPKKTDAEWRAQNPLLRNGEIILVAFEGVKVRAKIGDGINKYSTLPFADYYIKDYIDHLDLSEFMPEYSITEEETATETTYRLTKDEKPVGAPIIVSKRSGALVGIKTVPSSSAANAKDEFKITKNADGTITIEVQEINMNKLVQTETVILDGTSEESING